MKKTVLHLILFCFLLSPSMAQTGADLPTGLKSNSPSDKPEYTFGYKKGPTKIKHLQRPPSDQRYKSSSALPAMFDLRTEGRVTSAKNQGSGDFGGNCSMFSSIGAIESRWLTMGLGEYDLSEQHMAACIGFDESEWGFGQGGNQFTCSAYMTRFTGPVYDSLNPYNVDVHPCLPFVKAMAYVPESRWLPTLDFELLKRTIYYYGAVFAGTQGPSGQNFNATDNTYYYNDTTTKPHAVLVCGWDDNKVTAGGIGAWICKNSWGEDWAEEGFYYVSYQDKKFGADEMAFYPTRWETDEVDVIYMHDEVGFTTELFMPLKKVYELARFDAAEVQMLTHVGVTVPQSETVLSFNIYEDFNGDELSNLIASREDIYVEIPGVYTFELPVLVNGDFFIEVSREVGADTVIHPIERIDPGYSNPVIQPDVNWVRREGGDWLEANVKDMNLDFNLTIRAFARTSTAPVGLFTTDKKEACLGSEITYTFLDNHPAESWTWDFGQDATPATANAKGPHKVSYSSEGTKTISLIVSGAGGADTTIRYDYIDIVPAIRVNILNDSIAFAQGRSHEITAYGADTYSWSPASMVDNPAAQSVMATPPAEGVHTLIVTGMQGSCISTDTILLKTTDRPPHDDMCNAMLITPGGWIGWWTNEFATAEEGEPSPEDTDCYAPLKWCRDTWGETVTNSLWYYFYGPETGIASLRTNGFDNQIAVYRADTCTDIKIENLIAANDDPDSQNPGILPATLGAVNVEAGKKYYLQVDGSHGGEVGAFELLFYAYPVEVDEQKIIQAFPSLSIFPNPGKDIFNIHLENAASSRVEITVYNLSGQILKQKSFEGITGKLDTRFDLSQYPGGIYHIQILDGDRILNGKLVKR